MTDTYGDLDAAILYDRAPAPLAFDILRERLNAALATYGVKLDETPATGGDLGLFSGEDLHLLISVIGEPLPDDSFADVLASPFTQLSKADFPARIAAHRAAIFMTVGDGAMPAAPGVPEPVRGVRAPLLKKIAVLHKAVLAILDLADAEALAVEWEQSGTLHTPLSVQRTAGQKYPTALLTHPALFCREGPSNERRLVGFVSRGSELFLGRTIVVPEGPEPARMIAAVNELIGLALERQAPFDDGEILELAEGGFLKLRHLPPEDPDFPGERLEVTAARTEAIVGAVVQGGGMAALTGDAASTSPAPQRSSPGGGAPSAAQPAQAAAAPKQKRFDEIADEAEYDQSADGAATFLDRMRQLATPDPDEPRLRYVVLSALVVLAAPPLGVPLAVVTVLLGPLPRLTLWLALFSFGYIALQLTGVI